MKVLEILAILAAGMVTPMAAMAEIGVPAEGALVFTVLRNGSEVGSHAIRFHDDGSELDVTVETDVNVKLPIVRLSVYHFKHRSQERSRGGSLVQLTSATDGDGTDRQLAVTREDARTAANLAPGSTTRPGSMMTGSRFSERASASLYGGYEA